MQGCADYICMGTCGTCTSIYFGSSSGAILTRTLRSHLRRLVISAWSMVPGYVIAQFAGAFAGAVLVYVLFSGQFEVNKRSGNKIRRIL